MLTILFSFTNDPYLQISKPELVSISGGTFMMGQDDGEGDERPAHEVTLSDFQIGKYEVTVAEYKRFCEDTEKEMPTEPEWGWKANHPIINTSWNDAMDYIKWLNLQTNETYRLPTEAEFEYVIRNGGESGVYPWGDDTPQDENLADVSFTQKTKSSRAWKNYNDGFAFTAPVGSFKANKLGVYDINGNIWEWCSDWHEDYTDKKVNNPTGPRSGIHKVGRGGSYNSDPWHSRTASRAFVKPTFKKPGFRLAKDIN